MSRLAPFTKKISGSKTVKPLPLVFSAMVVSDSTTQNIAAKNLCFLIRKRFDLSPTLTMSRASKACSNKAFTKFFRGWELRLKKPPGDFKVKNKKSTFQRGKKNETCHQFSSPYKLQKSQSKKKKHWNRKKTLKNCYYFPPILPSALWSAAMWHRQRFVPHWTKASSLRRGTKLPSQTTNNLLVHRYIRWSYKAS